MYFTIYNLGIFATVFGEYMDAQQSDALIIHLSVNEGQNDDSVPPRVSTCGNSGKYPLTACHALQEISQYKELKRSSEVLPYSTYNQARREKIKPKSITSFLEMHKDAETLSECSDRYKNVIKQNDLSILFNRDIDGDTILHLAIVHNDEVKTKILVQKMKEQTLDIFNNLHQTPLHLCVLTCQPAMVRFLIINGANVNARDRNGQTSLHLASKNADIDSVKAIKEGLEIREKDEEVHYERVECNSKNFQGQAAIHLAVLSGSEEIVIKLLEMEANINIQDGTSGRTALHHAVEVHNINMVKFLLQNNADVNTSTFSGTTALHLATGYCMDQIVRILIRNGANINLKNVEGDTPFDLMNCRKKTK